MSSTITSPLDPHEDVYLGVTSSALGRSWHLVPVDEREALFLSQQLSVHALTARVLAARGITVEDAPRYLEPRLRDWLPDPSSLTGMASGAARLARAIMQGERIGIFGDYDVDGATSSALLLRFFAAVGAEGVVHIPDRISEGYGPNVPGLMGLKENAGVSLVVTVDCGTSAYEPLERVKKAGLDVVVVDHHTAEPELPAAVAVINPNRLDDTSGLGHLAAVGVVFLLAIAVNRVLRDAGWFKTRQEPDLMAWLDLVSLGTVCDVVPLRGLNRAFVTQGLKVMQRRGNIGITALADSAGLDETPAAYHLGFVLGPRVNAGGRVGASDLGYRLLSTSHPDEAWHLAQKLSSLNQERKDIEQNVLDAAIDQVEQTGDLGAVVVAADPGWHPGVVGIVASRLKDRFNRPAFVIGSAETGASSGTGSGRSIVGVDLGGAVVAAVQTGLLQKGGGHQMAAGCTIDFDQVPAFKAFLDERIGRVIAERGLKPITRVDGSLNPAAATRALAEELETLGPFGAGHPEPRYVIPHARLTHVDEVGSGGHLRCAIHRDGADGPKTLGGIAFRAFDSALGPLLKNAAARGLGVHLLGRLKLNRWQGRVTAQFQIEDAATPVE